MVEGRRGACHLRDQWFALVALPRVCRSLSFFLPFLHAPPIADLPYKGSQKYTYKDRMCPRVVKGARLGIDVYSIQRC